MYHNVLVSKLIYYCRSCHPVLCVQIRDPGGISQIFFLRVFGLKILKFFDADPDPDPGYGILSTLDPRWKHLDPG